MAAIDDKTARTLREDVAELQLAINRKRNEISNLKVGYIRAVEGASPIPAEPLRRNLISARAELTQLEDRLAAVTTQLGPPSQAQ